MSKAEELLDSLVEAYAAESDSSSDPHIVIGTDRFIVVPDELKRIAVQYDHNIRTVTFDCPRYCDGRDLSKMKVYINYKHLNDKSIEGSYIADNVRVSVNNSSVMNFDWTIKRSITQSKGNLAILVCIRSADAEGNEENHWNSELNTELYISEGMEYGSEIIEAQYPDIVTQLLQRMDAVEALATPEAMQGYANAWLEENSDAIIGDIQNKGNEVLASIPEEYTATYEYASEGARTKADAIIRTVEGETIAVSDSSDDYVRGLRVFGKTTQLTTTGKNLIRVIYPGVIDMGNGASISIDEDGFYTLSGMISVEDTTVSYSVSIGNISLEAGTEYIISNNTSGYPYFEVNNASINPTVARTKDQQQCRFTASETTVVPVYCTVPTNTNFDNLKLYPMVRLASIEDDTWEPYTGGIPPPNPDYPQDLVSIENPTVHLYGKNIANLSIHSGSANYVSLIDVIDLSAIKKGRTYTLSVWLDSEVDSICYWNNAAKVFGYLEFNVHAGLHRYTYTFVAAEDGANHTSPVNVLNKYPTNDGKVIAASNAQLEEGPEATEYTPFEVQSLITAHTLLGIPVTSGGNYTDSNGQQWICDEVDFERGVYVQRIAHYIFDGSEDEAWSGIYNYGEKDIDYVNIHLVRSRDLYSTPLICNRMVRRTWNEEFTCFINEYDRFVVGGSYYDGRMANLDTFKSYLSMNPLELVYVLETPIETHLTAEELETFRQLRSNYHNTTVLNDSGVKMELRYNADTQLYIDNKIAEAIAALTGNA